MEETERLQRFRLQLAGFNGSEYLQALLEELGSAGAVFRAPDARLLRVRGIGPGRLAQLRQAPSLEEAQTELDAVRQAGIALKVLGEAGYPDEIAEPLHFPPLALMVRGTLEEPPGGIRIAIVGSRRPTAYGIQQARRFAEDLGGRGCCIVSGLARGIDAEAHRGALRVEGRTIAILGSGVANIYPREHQQLAGRIARSGAVVSEFPLNAPPLKGHFPRRNRLISAFSEAVVVVEAAMNSGSLITARWALEQGREVMALPGPVDRPTSRGTNQLLKDGATLVEGPADVVQALELLYGVSSPEPFSMQEQELARCFADRSSHSLEELLGATGWTVSTLLRVLSGLEVRGRVRRFPDRSYLWVGEPVSAAAS